MHQDENFQEKGLSLEGLNGLYFQPLVFPDGAIQPASPTSPIAPKPRQHAQSKGATHAGFGPRPLSRASPLARDCPLRKVVRGRMAGLLTAACSAGLRRPPAARPPSTAIVRRLPLRHGHRARQRLHHPPPQACNTHNTHSQPGNGEPERREAGREGEEGGRWEMGAEATG